MPSSTPFGPGFSASSPEPSGPTPPGDGGGSGVDSSTVSTRVKNAIAITITAVWAGGICVDAILADFSLSPFVHSAMLGLATSIFGSSFVKGIR
jgi:hypothetical protein